MPTQRLYDDIELARTYDAGNTMRDSSLAAWVSLTGVFRAALADVWPGESRMVGGRGARVVIRTTVRERLDSLVYRYWPELLDSDRLRFPGADDITTDFQRDGFEVVTVTSFSQRVADDLATYRNRLVSRPQSKFTYLTDEQFRGGLRRLDADIPNSNGPVEERYDVLVYER